MANAPLPTPALRSPVPSTRPAATIGWSPPAAANANRGGTFVVPHDLGLGPVPGACFGRAPRTPVPEVVVSEKLPGGRYVAMTALEAAGLVAAVCDPANALVVPWAHVLHYDVVRPHDAIVAARHRPEIVARRRDGGVTAYTLLSTWERDRSSAAWKRIEGEVREAYRRIGVEFRVLTEHTLFRRQERENCARMLRERAGADAPDLAAVRRAIAVGTLPTTVARLHRAARPAGPRRVDRTLACVIELALAGVVRLDHALPLGPGTRILPGALA